MGPSLPTPLVSYNVFLLVLVTCLPIAIVVWPTPSALCPQDSQPLVAGPPVLCQGGERVDGVTLVLGKQSCFLCPGHVTSRGLNGTAARGPSSGLWRLLGGVLAACPCWTWLVQPRAAGGGGARPVLQGPGHSCSCPGEGAAEGGVACGSAEPRPARGLLSGARGLLHWCHFVCNVGLKSAFAECRPSVDSYRDQPREESGATTVFGGGNGLPAVSASLTPRGDRAQPRPSTRPVIHPGPASWGP